MGKRYESKRGEVRDSRKEGERIWADRETLKNEYSLFSYIDNLLSDLDDEVGQAVESVENSGEQENTRLEFEHQENENEKAKIADEIDEELDKLRSGMESLNATDNNPFGKKSVEQAKKEYKEQSDKYRKLIEKLDMESVESHGGSIENSGAVSEGITEFGYNSLNKSGLSFFDVSLSNGLKPNRSTPRDLPTTAYGFTTGPNGEQTYDSPMEMDNYLYASQGSAYTNFKGTCGLCSVANVMRLSGVDVSEKDVIDYAANTYASDNPFTNYIPWANRLCTVNPLDPKASGATDPQNRKAILEHFGISSGLFSVKMEGGIASAEALEDIANYVSNGRGVIISVHASVLEPGMYVNDLNSDFHAVTVTSVTRDKDGKVSGFYICDSNRGTSYYPAVKVQNALTGSDMNVTHSHIR